jgi:hypothetical protein
MPVSFNQTGGSMTPKAVTTFALIYGVLFLLVGILGFIPGVTRMHEGAPELTVEGPGHGYLLGLFHVNVLHNLVHVIFGVWGLAVMRSFSASRIYGQAVAVIYALLGVFGLIPALNTLFGLVPLHGNDVWLHFLLAAIAAVFGFAPVAGETARYETPAM